MNAEEQNKQNYLIERRNIPTTPFTAIKMDEKGWFAAIQNYRITEKFENLEDLKRYINKKPWELLTTVIGVIVELQEEIKKLK